jgi:hypothetical protein
MTEFVTSIQFDAPPAIGTVLTQAGRPFVVAKVEPATRKDGSPTWLITWVSPCCICGEPFETKSGLRTKGVPASCVKHRSELIASRRRYFAQRKGTRRS